MLLYLCSDPLKLYHYHGFGGHSERLYVEQCHLIQTLCGGTGVTDVRDIMGITDIMDVTDITGVTDVTGFTDVARVTDITGRCGSYGHYGRCRSYGCCGRNRHYGRCRSYVRCGYYGRYCPTYGLLKL